MAPTARLVITWESHTVHATFSARRGTVPKGTRCSGLRCANRLTIDVRDLSNICNNEKRFKNAGPPARISASCDARGWAASSTITIVSRRENSTVPPKRRPVANYANPTRPKPGQTSSLSHWMMRTQVGFGCVRSTAIDR
jgi:hypothetical protein